MAVVKYRAWHHDSKLMFDVLAIAFQKQQIVVKWHGVERAIDIKQFTLMLLTGSKDKTGLGVYEGDIFIANSNIEFEVYWHDESFCFSCKRKDDDYSYNLWQFKPENIEVMGHIYQKENPQLS